MYPNNEMQINVYATSAPNVTFTTQGALVNAVGELAFYVILSNGSLAHVFTLSGTATTEALALISGEVIYGKEAAMIKLSTQQT